MKKFLIVLFLLLVPAASLHGELKYLEVTAPGSRLLQLAIAPPVAVGGAQNVAFANGSSAMQATWSNDSASCRISHPIVTNGGTTNDFSISESPTSRSVVRGSATTTTVTTAVVAGAAQTVTLTAAGLPAGRRQAGA